MCIDALAKKLFRKNSDSPLEESTQSPAIEYTEEIQANNNPWDLDVPYAPDNIWTHSNAITSDMGLKTTGVVGKSMHQFICEKYLWPSLQNWNAMTHSDIKRQAYQFKNMKKPQSYRCLIMGSTELEIEKFLWHWGYVGELLIVDIAEKALMRCKKEADSMGKKNINFVVEDLNTATFDGKFDFVITNGILHHLECQANCLDMINSVLTAEGLLLAVEYTGPFRFQLPKLQVDWINGLLAMMPAGLRLPASEHNGMAPLPADAHWSRPFKPIAEELLISIDPTEALTGHILEDNLLSRFDLIQHSQAGGTLSTYLHEHLDYKKTNETPLKQWMESPIGVETKLIEDGVLKSDFSFYVMKRRGEVSTLS